MKKKFMIVICVICLALTMGLLVSCGDDKPSGETDPIIGTWIGTEQGENYTRNFYANIVFESNKEVTTFKIDVKVILKDKETELLTDGNINKNPKIENQYHFNGDFSPLPHGVDKQKYYYRFEMDGNAKITVTERNFSNHDKLTGRIISFERTTLTLEQYEDQLKAVQE